MRQIKFRGKTTVNGHWVYGSLIVYADYTCAIRNRKSQPWVQPDTVGQYTGFDDNTGTEIYEGDVVEYQSDCGRIISEVVFCDGAFCVEDGAYLLCEYSNECKIVGNIHDNPEILNNEINA